MKFLFMFLLLSCGRLDLRENKHPTTPPFDPSAQEVTDPIFQPYVKQFEQEFNVKTQVPVIFIPTLGDRIIAVCTPQSIIKFSKEVFEEKARYYGGLGASLFDRWIFRVLKHEMGHCHYNLDHDNSIVLFQDNISSSLGSNSSWIGTEKIYIPRSIMYSYIVPDPVYEGRVEYYDLELKKESSEKILDIKNFKSDKLAPDFQGYFPHYKDMGEYKIEDLSKNVIMNTSDYSSYLGKFAGYSLRKNWNLDTENLPIRCGVE